MMQTSGILLFMLAMLTLNVTPGPPIGAVSSGQTSHLALLLERLNELLDTGHEIQILNNSCVKSIKRCATHYYYLEALPPGRISQSPAQVYSPARGGRYSQRTSFCTLRANSRLSGSRKRSRAFSFLARKT